jgi:hypothetical protein
MTDFLVTLPHLAVSGGEAVSSSGARAVIVKNLLLKPQCWSFGATAAGHPA